MYNRYIPDGAVYTRVTMDDDEPRRPREPERQEKQEHRERPRSQGRSHPPPPPPRPPGGGYNRMKTHH